MWRVSHVLPPRRPNTMNRDKDNDRRTTDGSPKRKPRNAVYLLPNAFTTAALLAGFFAILQASGNENNWQQAALAVFIAALLDACDGRVARWTGTQSSFGAEYDSLADVVAFGVAPALIIYQWALADFGKWGLSAAFCYCAATAMRLARFNSQSGSTDHRFFIGIPSPAAAILLVSYVAVLDAWEIASSVNSQAIAISSAIVAILIAVTMVSGIRYYSFKDLNIRRRVPFRYVAIFFIAAATLYVLADTIMEVLLLVFGGYWLSGYVYAAWKVIFRRR